jgi:hypothetical protein
MHGKRKRLHSTRVTSKVASRMWTVFQEVALAGWASTVRLAMLVLVKQGMIDVLILLVTRRR